jgi:hypothetical protein
MARTGLVRGAAAGGVLFIALAAGSGVAAAAPPYGGTSGGGVTTSGGGSATFTGSGYGPGSTVTLTVTYCGTSHTFTGTAGSIGVVSIPATGAGQTSFSATGTDPNGAPLTETSSAVLNAACPGGGAGGGGGGGGSLPFTGFEVGAVSAVGLGAIGAGVIVLVVSRRRRGEAAA